MKFGCLLAIGIMAGFVTLLSIIVLKSCGFNEGNARAVSSDLGDKVLIVLVVLVLTTGSAYWVGRAYTRFRDRKLPPALPVPPPQVPIRPRPLIQEAISRVAPPPSGNQAIAGESRSGNDRAEKIMGNATGDDIRGSGRPMRLGKNCPGIFDQPANFLEQRMVAARAGEIPMGEFLREFFESKVAVLVPEGQFEERGGVCRLGDNPMLFTLSYPGHAVAGLFTDTSRTAPVTKLHPAFRFAVMVNAGSLIRKLGPGHGFAINPY